LDFTDEFCSIFRASKILIMIIVISPAKTLDYESPIGVHGSSDISFPEESKQLMRQLKKLSPKEISDLMKVSSKIAYLNHDRFAEWQWPFPAASTRQAIFAFKGEVYHGMDAYSLSQDETDFAQSHLRMLSGLYGVLRAYDRIMPYRLEMGIKLAYGKHKNLYQFWGNKITKKLQSELDHQQHKVLVNLASNEYFKSVNMAKLKAEIITPVFKEARGDSYKTITMYAKKARGMMCRFIIQNKIEDPEDLKLFDLEGYYYHEVLSTNNEFTFTRG